MHVHHRSRAAAGLVVAVLFLSLTGLAAAEKIPVTTGSEEARSHFLEGRTLVDNLRLTDAIAHFQKAVQKDPDFALAHLYLSQTAPTAKEFWASLNRAVALAPKASEGEQIWINGVRAGAYGDPETQRKLYTKLTELFPRDERAQTLLGIVYFGQQDYATAAKHLQKAVDLNPGFAPAYNQLGYAYRFLEKYADAERTFKKYTELIPADPNPYDSYAELLLKLGRFDDAIAQYRKALAVNPQFANSGTGIAAALMYQGKHGEARAELQKLEQAARTDGERRAALFATTVVWLDEGNTDQALAAVGKQYALGENIKDPGAMAGDCVLRGNILLEAGRYDEALAAFAKSVELVKGSDLAQQVKDNTALFFHYNTARVAVARKDLKTADAETKEFRAGAEARKNPNQIRLAHELAGMTALAGGKHETAIAELRQANQQNPYNLYRLAQAYLAKGDRKLAGEFAGRAAHFNSLPNPNYAFVRTRAAKMAAEL